IYDIIDSCDLAVDCIFGTGFTGSIDNKISDVVEKVNKKPVIACDIPSGAQCDDGKVKGTCIKAIKTITFVTLKPCHYLYPSKNFCGEIKIADIGIPYEAVEKQKPYIKLITENDIDNIIKIRMQNTHKGSYGSLQMVCGSENMIGAAYLAAQGALRSGVGLIYMAIEGRAREILQCKLSEPVFVKRDAEIKSTAILIGCGLGKDSFLLNEYLKRKKPTVIDADGLNYLSQNPDILNEDNNEQLILTPHPLEMSRLCGLSVEEIEGNRIETARNFAIQKKLILILKGKHTLIATPGGNVYINTTGNTGLAKGGSGDVLAGIISGLLAQGYSTEESAISGVYLHGKAADILKEEISEYGMLPSDLPLTVAIILKKYNG
ncbi:MAG: carbohydrate kinase, partial [Clostridia bacterium]|nr:carbohydrate kinase [Clostridia bacterium]